MSNLSVQMREVFFDTSGSLGHPRANQLIARAYELGFSFFVQSLAKVLISAETVEKVRMANSDNFSTVRNQRLTGHRKPQNDQIYGFSTASLYLLCFRTIKKVSI